MKVASVFNATLLMSFLTLLSSKINGLDIPPTSSFPGGNSTTGGDFPPGTSQGEVNGMTRMNSGVMAGTQGEVNGMTGMKGMTGMYGTQMTPMDSGEVNGMTGMKGMTMTPMYSGEVNGMTGMKGMTGMNNINVTMGGNYNGTKPEDEGQNGLVEALQSAGIFDPPSLDTLSNPRVTLPKCTQSIDCNKQFKISIQPLSGLNKTHDFFGGVCMKKADANTNGLCMPFEILPLLSCPKCDFMANSCQNGACVPRPLNEDKPCPVPCNSFTKCLYGICIVDPTKFNTDLSQLVTAPTTSITAPQLGENVKQPVNSNQIINGQFKFGNNGTAGNSDGIRSALQLAQNIQVQFEKVSTEINSAFQIATNALVNISDTLSILPNKTCSFIFDSSNSNGFASVGKLDLKGALKIAGSGIFQFPPTSDAITINDGASAIVSSGVGLKGNGGKLTINIDDPSPYNRKVSIPVGSNFESLGDIISTASNKTSSGAPDALLQIAGTFIARGTQIQPRMQISNGGTLKIVTTSYQDSNGQNTTKFFGGDLLLTSGSNLQIQNGNGANTYFKEFSQCDASAVITYQLNKPLNDAPSGTILNFATITNTTNLKCQIKIKDVNGASINVVNPNTQSTSGASRRLLQASSTQASWNSGSLTYSSPSNDNGGSNTQSSAAFNHLYASVATIAIPTIMAGLLWGV